MFGSVKPTIFFIRLQALVYSLCLVRLTVLLLSVLWSLNISALQSNEGSAPPAPQDTEDETAAYQTFREKLRQSQSVKSAEDSEQDASLYSESNFEYCNGQPWLDDWYCNFNYGIGSIVVEVNRWFVDKTRVPSSKRPRASGKLRFGWEPRSGDLSELDLRFKIKVKLPALEDRVELLLSDDENDVNQQAVKAARSQQFGNDDQATLALQFKDKVDSNIAYRLGIGRGSQLYTRARYSDLYIIDKQNRINYFAEVNYYTSDQLGVESNITFSHTISKNKAIGFNNTFRYRDKTEDLFWRHEIQYLFLQDEKTSYLFTAMIDGLNKPSFREEQVLLSMRYKRNVLRPWLFVELEPFLLWLREENFTTSYGIAARAEVHF